MNPSPSIVASVFQHDPTTPVARLVHMALAVLADEQGHVETTVHTLEHLTGLIPDAIEIALGYNALDMPMLPASVSLIDGVVTADLHLAAAPEPCGARP